MKIKSITLKNYRQFIDEKINFSTNEEKPYTIILGDNSYGKTTFVRAFIWCLFDNSKKEYFDTPLLNRDVEKSLDNDNYAEVKVIVELEHKNIDYSIENTKKYQKTSDGLVEFNSIKTIKKNYFIKDKGSISEEISTTDDKQKVANEIDDIMSSELIDYFFFDGENNKIDNASEKKSLSKTVSELLGLETIKQIQNYFNPKDYNSVTRVFSKMNGKDMESTINLQNLETEKNSIESEFNKKNVRISELENHIEENDAKIKELKQKIYQSSEYDVIKPQIEELKSNNKNKKDSITKNKIELLEIFSSKAPIMKKLNVNYGDFNNKSGLKIKELPLVQALLYKSFLNNDFEKEFSQSAFLGNEALEDIHEKVVEQLIKRGYCICGTKINNNEEALNHLMMEKSKMEPHNYSKYVENYINKNVLDYKDKFESVSTKIKLTYQNLRKDNETYIASGEEIKKLESKLQEYSYLEQFMSQRDKLTEKNGGIKEEIKVLKIEIKELEIKLKEIDNKIVEEGRKNEDNKFNLLAKSYCEKIFNLASNEYQTKREDIVKNLREEITIAFNRMYHGNRKILLDDNFNVTTTLVENEDSIDSSTGTKTVVNFAFIATIIKMMKEKERKKRENEKYQLMSDKEGREYPLIMDAPFSNMDENHIKNVSEILVEYCNQIILIVMEKDFKNVSDKLKNRIGDLYKINKKSETTAEIIKENI